MLIGKINMTPYTSLLTSGVVDVDDYEFDKKRLNKQIADLNSALENCNENIDTLQKQMGMQYMEVMKTHLFFQREFVMTAKDLEVAYRCQKKWSEMPLFTRVFRKKYIEKEFTKIKEEVDTQFSSRLDTIQKAINKMVKAND